MSRPASLAKSPPIHRRRVLGAVTASLTGVTSMAALGSLGSLSGCGGLLPKAAPAPRLYTLQDSGTAAPPSRAVPAVATLVIAPVQSPPGQDGRWIAYQRQPGQLSFYADSEWADTPARLLAPLLIRAAERTGAFLAVLMDPAAVQAELRLDTTLLALTHDFSQSPSRVRLALRATVVDVPRRRVLRSREFEATALAPSEDAAGGAAAAQSAALAVAAAVAAFTAASPAA